MSGSQNPVNAMREYAAVNPYEARALFLRGLRVALLLSVAGNIWFGVRHGIDSGDGRLSIALSAGLHASFPLLLWLIIKIFETSTQLFVDDRAKMAKRGAILVAVLTFVSSAQGLFMIGVWSGFPPQLAWIVPGAIDITIMVCGAMLDNVARLLGEEAVQEKADREVIQSVGEPFESPVRASFEQPARPSFEQSGELDPRRSNEVAHHSDERLAQEPFEAGKSSSPGSDQAVHPFEQPAQAPGESVDEPFEIGPGEPFKQAATESFEQSIEPGEFAAVWAARTLGETGVTADERELAKVLERHVQGWSRQRIADDVGRSKSTINGWVKAAEPVRPELVGGPSAGDR